MAFRALAASVSKQGRTASHTRWSTRLLSTLNRDLSTVQDLFAEARMLLKDAEDSKGTVYFSEDFEDAKKGVFDTLKAYDALLERSTGNEKESIKNANDPKMRQLEEEYRTLEDQLIHDED